MINLNNICIALAWPQFLLQNKNINYPAYLSLKKVFKIEIKTQISAPILGPFRSTLKLNMERLTEFN